MLAAASVSQRFSVALWGSFIRFPAPFCASRKQSHLCHTLSCHRNQAESIAFLPSHCFEGSALPLLHLFDVCVRHNIMMGKQEEGAVERRHDEKGSVFHEDP
jgi:hypothetical protein